MSRGTAGPDPGWVSSGRWIGALGVAIVVLVVIALSRGNTPYTPYAAAADQHGATDVAGTPVTVGVSDCGAGWDGGAAGVLTFALWNPAEATEDVFLQSVDTHRIYLDVEGIGLDATRSATVALAAGSYRFVCGSTEAGTVAGPTVQVTGAYDGALTPGTLPVTAADLTTPVLSYQRWVGSRLPVLQRQVARLASDLRDGDVAAAKRDWLTAHRTYGTLGAAYGAFGDDNDAIDGLTRPGVAAVSDPRLAGFHKIEALLWHGRPAAAALPVARRLVPAVAALRRDFGTKLFMAPIDIGLRAHEILEDALQVTLQGRDDAGSHTALATVDANVTGTRHALSALRGLLRPRDPDLAATDAWLDRLQRLVRSQRHGAAWTPLSGLSRSVRERLDADLDQTLELLSEVAVITDPVKQMP